MADKTHKGPLHLQPYLAPCTDSIAEIIRSAVGHSVSMVTSLRCRCAPSGVLQAVSDPQSSISARTAEARRRNIESSRSTIPAAEKAGSAAAPDDRRLDCRFFSLRTNDEEAVFHSFCRRCDKRILLYDRVLYWGTKRQTGVTPPTYPYKCCCGSHTFEIAIGLTYPEEALDENDLDLITLAVRCASCNEVAVIFDDEAT
ncbi:MAG TPA: hypothetical protein VEK08_17940 [Planctomycetota bacterium]|nr:hypothetical protein [Planctomycetota bacterium]